jgi:hypothetical protein
MTAAVTRPNMRAVSAPNHTVRRTQLAARYTALVQAAPTPQVRVPPWHAEITQMAQMGRSWSQGSTGLPVG